MIIFFWGRALSLVVCFRGVASVEANLSTKIAGFSVSVPGFPNSCLSNEINWPSSCLLLVSVLLS